MTSLPILVSVVVCKVDSDVRGSLSDNWQLHPVSAYPPCHLSSPLNFLFCFHDCPAWAVNEFLFETPDPYLRALPLCEL